MAISSNEAGPALRVLTRLGEPIPGALVVGIRGAKSKAYGATDGVGRVPVSGLSEVDRLCVSKEGYALAELPVKGVNPTEDTLVHLEPEGVIEGRLVSVHGGQPVGAGIRVAAWPTTRRMPRSLDYTLAAAGSPGVLTSVSDEQGHFVLGRLNTELTYSLAAAGAGHVGSTVLSPVTPGGPAVELPVGFLYGLLFELVEPSGVAMEQAAWSSSWHGSRFIKISGRPDPTSTELGDAVARLAGVSLPGEGELFNLVVFYSELKAARVGPFDITVSLPGRGEQVFGAFAYPLTAELQTNELELAPLTSPLGELRVDFDPLPGFVERADASLHAGVLHLLVPGGEPILVGCSFGDLRRGLSLPGIPAGSYRMAFKGNLGFYERVYRSESGSLVEVMVEGGSTTTLDLSLEDAGLIGLELLGRSGESVQKHVGFEPCLLLEEGGERRQIRKGTVRSRDALRGELPALLVGPGRYQIDPMTSVIGLDPPLDVGPTGRFVRPLQVEVGPGEEVVLLWQKF